MLCLKITLGQRLLSLFGEDNQRYRGINNSNVSLCILSYMQTVCQTLKLDGSTLEYKRGIPKNNFPESLYSIPNLRRKLFDYS